MLCQVMSTHRVLCARSRPAKAGLAWEARNVFSSVHPAVSPLRETRFLLSEKHSNTVSPIRETGKRCLSSQRNSPSRKRGSSSQRHSSSTKLCFSSQRKSLSRKHCIALEKHKINVSPLKEAVPQTNTACLLNPTLFSDRARPARADLAREARDCRSPPRSLLSVCSP